MKKKKERERERETATALVVKLKVSVDVFISVQFNSLEWSTFLKLKTRMIKLGAKRF